ncbi:proteasome-activating nucleotidase [Euryarchaeota archaeon]|jgi:proteasome regulatory subunit|nr:proteasome-activating nucleotidase [Candidatus Thalassarchaeum sp.]MDA7556220.1 proteasome-activating nucleotidase [Euryarchaeota archaeon]MDB3854724.1 proteasome-activating nucleotidase [Euryarchaeota archaeon]MDB4865586.1 proteasome-activating nucleotidase [Euryarchaeota archaeon]MDC0851983.1 proteasome-activating nucleotidase [Euryarchaeota archaeon]
MASRAGSPRKDKTTPESSQDIVTAQVLEELREQYALLSDDAKQLMTEKMYLENELNQLKKRINRLDEEIRSLRTPPYIIGNVQDVIGEKVVVRSSNGTIFLVSKNPRIDSSKMQPGARVSMNQDTLAVIDILDEAFDPLVSGAEIIDKPNIKYSDLGGLDEQIREVRDAIELSLEKPEEFERFGIQPPKGVLLTGPPGTGKTMLAKAVANQTNATFLGLVGSELAQKYIGEGGRMVRELFALARKKAPCIIFIDEIDAIGSKRLDSSTSGDREVQRTLMQLLSELDGFESLENVKVIAATNRPELLDKALLRPGRFDRIVEIPLPGIEGREAIFKVHAKKMPLDKNVDFAKLSIITDGYSGAEIKAVTIDVGMNAISEGVTKCKMSHFKEAIYSIDAKRKGVKNNGPDRLYG